MRVVVLSNPSPPPLPSPLPYSSCLLLYLNCRSLKFHAVSIPRPPLWALPLMINFEFHDLCTHTYAYILGIILNLGSAYEEEHIWCLSF